VRCICALPWEINETGLGRAGKNLNRRAFTSKQPFSREASMITSRWTLTLLLILVASLALTDTAQAFWNKKSVNTNWQGLAVKGYDPVAYFVDGRPIKGKKEFEFEWSGAKWRFADAEHLERFKSDPERYAPQYGGY
jgi:YHS domain-containing protein